MSLIFSEVLDLVDKAKTKEEKIGLLRKHSMPAYKGILRINFDETISMGLPPGEPPYKKEGGMWPCVPGIDDVDLFFESPANIKHIQ